MRFLELEVVLEVISSFNPRFYDFSGEIGTKRKSQLEALRQWKKSFQKIDSAYTFIPFLIFKKSTVLHGW